VRLLIQSGIITSLEKLFEEPSYLQHLAFALTRLRLRDTFGKNTTLRKNAYSAHPM
jgi:hypothetical protein